MGTYNSKKYIKYKKKQELLNKRQVNLTLDKNIAEGLQKNLKGENKIFFEHQLKSYFLNKPALKTLQIQANDPLNEIMPKINILMTELQEEIKTINKTMKILTERLEMLTHKSNDIKIDKKFTELKQINDDQIILNQSSNTPTKK